MYIQNRSSRKEETTCQSSACPTTLQVVHRIFTPAPEGEGQYPRFTGEKTEAQET